MPPLLQSVGRSHSLSPSGRRISHCRHEGGVWVLDYLLAGRGLNIRCGGEWRERLPGVAHLYPPGTSYDEDYTHVSSFRSCWMLFKGDSPFLRSLVDSPSGFARIEDRAGELGSNLRTLVEEVAQNGRFGYNIALSRFFAILSLLEKLHRIPDTQDYALDGTLPPDESTSRRVLRYLEKNFARHLSLGDIAHGLGIGMSSMQHKFKEETGETIVEALRRIRVEQSVPMLRLGFSLKEIASATGFPNPFYYSKVFKQQLGFSPREMR